MTTTPAIAPAPPAPAVTAAPVAALPPEPQTPEPQIPKVRKFTVAEYYRMAEVGILSPEERVQLIEGEIIVMPPIGPGHASSVALSIHAFSRPAGNQFIIQVQNPLHLADGSEPEPDVMLLRPRADYYATAHPTPADTFVVLEVSDSTLEFDRNRKAQVYGRAGVAQTLVLNLPEDCIENFTEPGPPGYGRHTLHRRGDKIQLIALPDVELAVADLLPLRPAAETDTDTDTVEDGGKEG